jgi:membrane protease subunit HflK
MRIPGDFDRARVLVMAGRKSPWGQGDDAAEADPPSPGSAAAPAGDGGAEDEVADKDGSPGRPLNPWLPPTGTEQERRSASIDDIFRQRARLRPGKGGPAGRNWAPLVLAGLIAAWIGGTSVHVLGKGEQGLVTSFGRYDRTIGPGPTLTLPWPAQAVAVRNTARIEETVLPAKDGENLMLTRDRQLVDLSAKLRWRIADLRRFSYGSADTPALIARLADGQVHAAVAEQRFDDLIEGQRRAELQQLVGARSQAALDALGLGVRVEGVEVIRAVPPQKLTQAFHKVGEARDAAREQVAKANGEAQKALRDATAEAARFESVYVQYQAAPEITRKRAYYETMERVLGNNGKVVIGGSGATVTVLPPALPAPAPTATQSGAP